MLKRISVLKQSKTGFAIRVIRGKETPVSKPDCIKSNNLDF